MSWFSPDNFPQEPSELHQIPFNQCVQRFPTEVRSFSQDAKAVSATITY